MSGTGLVPYFVGVDGIRGEGRILVVVLAAALIVGGLDLVSDRLRLPFWLQAVLIIVVAAAVLPALIRWALPSRSR